LKVERFEVTDSAFPSLIGKAINERMKMAEGKEPPAVRLLNKSKVRSGDWFLHTL
jgi:hypothetical protein